MLASDGDIAHGCIGERPFWRVHRFPALGQNPVPPRTLWQVVFNTTRY
ncbi:UNVERIFIED_ORG: hypothetical protein QOE_3351 [Clostridioides difficile F501]